MITKDSPTVLRLEGIGVPPYSARGLTQSLEPISMSQHIERSINGRLIDFSYEPMRKYRSTISGADQRPPAVDGVWSGKLVIVECIAELGKWGGPDNLQREPVDYDSFRSEKGFTYYRPRLIMMVTNWQMDQDEWEAGVGWSLDLEED